MPCHLLLALPCSVCGGQNLVRGEVIAKKQKQIHVGTEIQPFWTSWSSGGAGCNPAFTNPSQGISGGISPSLQAAYIQDSWSWFSPSKGVINMN